jgi:hypothetical protein
MIIGLRQMDLTFFFSYPTMQLDWFQLFDELKRRGHFGSDAQLADSLELTRSQICAWRKNKNDLETLTKFDILDALGHDTLRSAVLSLLPEKTAKNL